MMATYLPSLILHPNSVTARIRFCPCSGVLFGGGGEGYQVLNTYLIRRFVV